jgi:hypothetical protein
VSFGNQLDVKEAKSLLLCRRDHNVNFFDNTEVYANGRAEEIMGQAIRELGWKRFSTPPRSSRWLAVGLQTSGWVYRFLPSSWVLQNHLF